MVWKNIPPDQKPNWANLHEGQRRYAVEQYNLALVRRGLPVDHPVPEQEGASGETAEKTPELSSEEQQVIDDFDTDLLDDTESMAPPAGGTRSAEADSSSQPAAKRTKPNQGSKRKGDMNLPGTAMDQGGSSGGGDGGGGESKVRTVALPNPTLSIHPHIRHYRKVHRFLTYGLAYNIVTTTTDKLSYMTTPLAYIPWDKPYLYLNPAEFAVLSDASHFNSVRVTVIARNVRIAFPTNTSSTKLATLNQNKDIMYAIGLNKQIHSIDMALSVAGMISSSPTEYSRAGDAGLALNFYGGIDETTEKEVLPYHQIGLPIPLPWYCCIPHWDRGTLKNEGWPCIQAYYRDMDADTMCGKELVTCEYKPKVGLIKKPHRAIYLSNFKGENANTINVDRNGMRFQSQITTVITDNTGREMTKKTEADAAMNVLNAIDTKVSYYDTIEKCQYISYGIFGNHDTQAQDSLHIGIQPIQAITPKETETTASLIAEYTDSQAYFEVICEAEVNTSYPTPYPLLDTTHVTEHGATFYNQAVPNTRTKSMFNGLYVS
uniref:VP2 n=1 Tax=Luscinia sibilans ambidensovirus TaxID=2794457 RepID=A0A8A4XEB6_9VIRU|nr:MAG: VP2 [Luscinia sibilans ambidensovirus]